MWNYRASSAKVKASTQGARVSHWAANAYGPVHNGSQRSSHLGPMEKWIWKNGWFLMVFECEAFCCGWFGDDWHHRKTMDPAMLRPAWPGRMFCVCAKCLAAALHMLWHMQDVQPVNDHEDVWIQCLWWLNHFESIFFLERKSFTCKKWAAWFFYDLAILEHVEQQSGCQVGRSMPTGKSESCGKK